MDDKEEIEEKLTPEEQQMKNEISKAIHNKARSFVEKALMPLNWCWPATIVLLVTRWVLNSIGYYDLSLYAATVFLWGPLLLIIAAASVFITLVYTISLFGAWHLFLQNAVFYFKAGFRKANNGRNKSDFDEETPPEEERKHEFYTPPLPDIEDPNKKDKDDEAL